MGVENLKTSKSQENKKQLLESLEESQESGSIALKEGPLNNTPSTIIVLTSRTANSLVQKIVEKRNSIALKSMGKRIDALMDSMENGVNIDINYPRIKDGRSILHELVIFGDEITLLEKLLRAGAFVNLKDHEKRGALHLATGPKTVARLLRAGAFVNAQDKYGNTPLHIAILMNKKKAPGVIKELLYGGADLEAEDINGFTPIDYYIPLSKVFPFHEEDARAIQNCIALNLCRRARSLHR